MSPRWLNRLKRRFDPQDRVRLLLSSADPELQRFMTNFGASGMTDMEHDGTITIMMDDARGATQACWMEEAAHALQFLQDGNVALSVENTQRNKREVEVAECLLSRSDDVLTDEEVEHYTRIIEEFGDLNAR